MAPIQNNSQIDFKSKIKEAEVYFTMGLFDEALGIYTQLAALDSEIDKDNLKVINERIDELKEKIAQDDKSMPPGMSSKHVEIAKQELTSAGTVEETLHSASALKELGLIEEATAQYESLLAMDCPPEIIVPDLTACLLKTLSPGKIIEKFDSLAAQDSLDSRKKAEIKFVLGIEMEKDGHKDLALELFKNASSLDPENDFVKDKIHELMARLSSGSRYDYLLNMKIVNSEQLQKALALSKKVKKSVEYILIDQFKIKKEDVGKSLSLFYGCPFVGFNANVNVPVELITNLKKSFLLHDAWVPLSWSKKGVEILLEDPRDLSKTGQIRGLIKTQKIIFSVGIREDIEKYINFFFSNLNRKEEQVEAMIDELDFVQDISFEEEEDYDDLDEVDEASGQVVKLVDQILVTAYRKEASDIHVETIHRDQVHGYPLPYGWCLSGISAASQFHGPWTAFQAENNGRA